MYKFFIFTVFNIPHFVMGVMLVVWESSSWVTPVGYINYLARFISGGEEHIAGMPLGWIMGGFFLLAAGCSTWSIFGKWRGRGFLLSFALMIPQQILLVFEAIGPIEAIYLSSYADGALYPREFIFNDQFKHILLPIIHFVAIAVHRLKWWRYET